MSKTVWISIAVVVVLLAAGWWVMAKNGQTVQAPAPSASSNEATPVAATASPEAVASESASPAASGKPVTVSGDEFSFTPAKLTAKVGQSVTVTFKNTGKLPHNFTIDELNVAGKTIQPGGTDTVTFTPTKAGTFTYYCSVGNHEAQGMKGTLTVQ